MIDYIYIIPTYNRFLLAKKVVDSILLFKQNCRIILLNDGSEDERYSLFENYNNNLVYLKNNINNGINCYWKTVRTLFQEISKYKFKHGIMMSDDFDFIENFALIINKYKNNSDIIRLFTQDKVNSNWGYKNWIDGAFCASYKFFSDFNFEIFPIQNRKFTSSMVGYQMTVRLNELNYNVLDIGSFLIHKGNENSVMHSAIRYQHYLESSKFNNYSPIICGIATIESRILHLEETINSIIDQVDKLIVYQNGYKELLPFLENEKIEIISSLDTNIDMGDAGKFFKVNEYKNCYYISIDDDLIYPEKYVENIINYLKLYNNDCIVTYHGRNFPKDATSYYRNAKERFRCLDNVIGNHEVQFGGTGVMAFYTNRVNIGFDYFKIANMADIWMGLYAKENSIKIMVLAHNKGWIKKCIHPIEKDIYTTYLYNSSVQDRLLKEYFTEKKVIEDMVKEDMVKVVNFNKIQYNTKVKKINIIINTYNRSESLIRLLKQISNYSENFDIVISLYNDGSNSTEIDNIRKYINKSPVQINYTEFNFNHGKFLYWHLVSKNFSDIKVMNADYYFMIPDDAILTDNYFDKAIKLYEIAKDKKGKKVICLNTFADTLRIGKKGWNSLSHTPYKINHDIWNSGWVDMEFICEKKFFDFFDYSFKEVDINLRKKRIFNGSGVGYVISKKLLFHNYIMCQVDRSLTYQESHPSVMNPERQFDVFANNISQ